jgi:HAE1 family hydrophobic/amphiphilic exporter-1
MEQRWRQSVSSSHLKKLSGQKLANRFNLFSSITANVNPSPGHSTGEAMKAIQEVFSQTMPSGYDYEYGGISREEAQNAGSNTTVLIYLICIVFIFLILACLYESFPCTFCGHTLCTIRTYGQFPLRTIVRTGE